MGAAAARSTRSARPSRLITEDIAIIIIAKIFYFVFDFSLMIRQTVNKMTSLYSKQLFGFAAVSEGKEFLEMV